MLRFSSHQSGFNLIELMVVIAVLGIVLTLGIPAFREIIQNVSIRSVAESLQNGLQIARSEAVRRNSQVRFTMGDNMGWAVGCVNISITCPAVIQFKDGAEGAKKEVYANKSPGGAVSVIFTPFGNVVQTANPITQIDIDSSASGIDARNLRILISSAGIVKMCDPQVAATDPRGC